MVVCIFITRNPSYQPIHHHSKVQNKLQKQDFIFLFEGFYSLDTKLYNFLIIT